MSIKADNGNARIWNGCIQYAFPENVTFIDQETEDTLATFNDIIFIRIDKEDEDIVFKCRSKYTSYIFKLYIKCTSDYNIEVLNEKIILLSHSDK